MSHVKNFFALKKGGNGAEIGKMHRLQCKKARRGKTEEHTEKDAFPCDLTLFSPIFHQVGGNRYELWLYTKIKFCLSRYSVCKERPEGREMGLDGYITRVNKTEQRSVSKSV